jgi:hypothetical protein
VTLFNVKTVHSACLTYKIGLAKNNELEDTILLRYDAVSMSNVILLRYFDPASSEHYFASQGKVSTYPLMQRHIPEE